MDSFDIILMSKQISAVKRAFLEARFLKQQQDIRSLESLALTTAPQLIVPPVLPGNGAVKSLNQERISPQNVADLG